MTPPGPGGLTQGWMVRYSLSHGQAEESQRDHETTRLPSWSIAITALAVCSVFSEEPANANAPTNVAAVTWGVRLAEFQKARPDAQCRVEHARDVLRELAATGEPHSVGLLAVLAV